MGCGGGTNTRGGLLALWSLLFFENMKGLVELEVCGDSKVVVDWVNDSGRLQSIALDN